MIDFCLDIGGTSITAACMRNGEICGKAFVFPAKAQTGKEEIARHFAAILDALQKESGGEAPQSIRMAFPGPFDYHKGISYMEGLDKFEAIYGLPLAELLCPFLAAPLRPVPFFFLNDVTAFALGEHQRLGPAERGLYVCIGTGCGSAFLVNGLPATENTPGVPPKGWIYPLPFRGKTIDDFISKRGLMALSTKFCGKAMEGKALSARCKAGDSHARDCFLFFGQTILEALSPVLQAFRPNRLSVGGQIMKSADLFLMPLEAYCGGNQVSLSVCTDTAKSALTGLCTIHHTAKSEDHYV